MLNFLYLCDHFISIGKKSFVVESTCGPQATPAKAQRNNSPDIE